MTPDPFPPETPDAASAPAERPVPGALPSAEAEPSSAQTSPGLPIPGFRGSIGLLIASVVLQLIVAVPWLIASGVDMSNPEAVIERMSVMSSVLTLVSTAILVLAVCGTAARRNLAIRGFGIAQIFLVVLLAPVMLLMNLAAADWTRAHLDPRPMPAEETAEPTVELSAQPAAPGRPWPNRRVIGSVLDTVESIYGQLADESWPVVIFFFCFLPAIGEEPLFRGLIGRGLVARYGAFGILLASFLFGLEHLTPDHIAATFLLGVVAQLVYLAVRSLWAPIVLHFANNLLAVSLDKFQRDAGSDFTGMIRLFDSGIPGPLAAASTLAVAGLLVLLFQMRTRWVLLEGSEWTPGYLTAEMPPVAAGAVATGTRASAAAMLSALLGCTTFAVTYGWYAFAAPRS